jgi:hypothetical protein
VQTRLGSRSSFANFAGQRPDVCSIKVAREEKPAIPFSNGEAVNECLVHDKLMLWGDELAEQTP